MCKLQSFSITQILREMIFWDSRSAKSAILTHLEALKFDFNEFLHFQQAEIQQINIFQRPQNGKNSTFRTSRLTKIDFT